MTEKQISYAKSLRQQIMITAKSGYGWDNEEAHDHFRSLGYGDSLRALSIRDLKELLQTLRHPGIAKPGKPLAEMDVHRKSANCMATEKQIRYAGILAARYAALKGIPSGKAFDAWHRFVNKYQKIDAIQFCKKVKASEVISVMERVFITTFGAHEFRALTGKTWMYNGQAYKKYLRKRPETSPEGAI